MRLQNSATAGDASRAYAEAIARRRKPGNSREPSGRLLYVPSHPGRELDIDLRRAGIPKWTDEGKVDFHSLRTTYCTLLMDSHANTKEAMTLMRHSTPDLTLQTYARTRPERLHALADVVGRVLDGSERVEDVPNGETHSEANVGNPNGAKGLPGAVEWWRRRESNPRPKKQTQRLLRV